jgi:hypothetical protein
MHAGATVGLDGVAGRKKLVLEGARSDDPVPGFEIDNLAELRAGRFIPSFFHW